MEHDVEEELIGLLAVAKRQQAALDEQFKVVQATVASFTEERKKMTVLLSAVRDAPKDTVEGLKTALQAAVETATQNSITRTKKSLKEAIDDSVARLDAAKDRTATASLVWGMVGVIIGGSIVGGMTWWVLH